LCSESDMSNSVLIGSQTRESATSEEDGLGIYEIIGISVGALVFVIILIFLYYKYKKHQDTKNRERLSRLQGRVVNRNNQSKIPAMSFQNPMYNDSNKERIFQTYLMTMWKTLQALIEVQQVKTAMI